MGGNEGTGWEGGSKCCLICSAFLPVSICGSKPCVLNVRIKQGHVPWLVYMPSDLLAAVLSPAKLGPSVTSVTELRALN